MKKLLCIALILLLAGCTLKHSSTVDLMPHADPQTSALTLYIYDGETITRQHLFETDQYRADVMEDFHQAQAQETAVDVTTLRPPFYGIEMGAGDYGTAYGLWADGYFIARNGKVYAFDYDFETFSTAHPWTDADEFSNLAVMPCLSQCMNRLLHAAERRGHKGRQTDQSDILANRCLHDRFGRNITSQIDHRIAVIFHDRLDDIFADVVNVALHRCNDHFSPAC